MATKTGFIFKSLVLLAALWFMTIGLILVKQPNVQLYDIVNPAPLKQRLVPAGVVTPPPPQRAPADAPGEFGKAVEISRDDLDKENQRIFDVGFDEHKFNQYVSDKISLHRALNDVRDEGCEKLLYPVDDLPDTSVIIIFHNEAWSTLFRTVHSVLDHSPPKLLKEILLVDDFSHRDILKKPLDEYIKQFPKVRVLRVKKREGSIRARNLGADEAKGTVLTYLDSHCECTKGWLEPLLYQVYLNWKNVAAPVIDLIDLDNFGFKVTEAKHTPIGCFNWKLNYNWCGMPEREKKRRNSVLDPIRSPTTGGGLFTIHRDFFMLIGKFDAEMDVWGGDNLELSFKMWMCGGAFEIIPCSHVGHVFIKKWPYVNDTKVDFFKKNSVRMAEVWMDEYRHYYYDNINYNLGEYGDVSDRKAIREKLKCKSFDWYIKNVIPEQKLPYEVLASGDIRNVAEDVCLESKRKTIGIAPCSDNIDQYWKLTDDRVIRRGDKCIYYSGKVLLVGSCKDEEGEEFEYLPNNLIRKINGDVCMEFDEEEQNVFMADCDPENMSQQWLWNRRIKSDITSPLAAVEDSEVVRKLLNE